MMLRLFTRVAILQRLAYPAYVLALLSLFGGVVLLGKVVFAEEEQQLPAAPPEVAAFVHQYASWSDLCAPYIDFGTRNYDSGSGELTYRWIGSESQYVGCNEDPHAIVGPIVRLLAPDSGGGSPPEDCVPLFEALNGGDFWSNWPVNVNEMPLPDIQGHDRYVWTGPRDLIAYCNNLASLPKTVTEAETFADPNFFDPPFEFSIELLRD